MENSLPALSLLILFVGIDVSKAKLDVACRAGQQLSQRVFANSAVGYQQLCDWLAGFAAKAVHICLEATGSYSPPVATFLEQAGYAVSVLNPAVLVDYRRSLNLRRKSDALDASLLARFAQERQPSLWHPLPQAVQVLRHWLRQRRQLLALHTQLTNFLEDPQLLAPIRQQWHKQREQIRQLQVISEVQVVRHLHQQPELLLLWQRLQTIPGIGWLSAAQLIAAVGSLSRFSHVGALVSFVGLAVSQQQSGSSVHRRPHLDHHGQRPLRALFYLAALNAMRSDPALAAWAQRLRERGKPEAIVHAAVMRKLVHIVYGVWKTGCDYDPQRAFPLQAA